MMRAIVDYCVSVVSPVKAVQRQYARKIERGYKGAEPNRLNSGSKPKNQSANSELQGPFGADGLRARARALVRDNPYAWSALESIVSEVIGSGFAVQSALEMPTGQDAEDTNENRDKTWCDWCEVCDINGQLTFDEIQSLAFREMVEAGECLIHFVTVPKVHNGIHRPVPLAVELIEADRLASDHDTYAIGRKRGGGMEGFRITRGVEMDEHGRPIAYWIYPAHPTEPNVFSRTPERIPANRVKHLFRKDRIGQSRGVTWFAPIVGMAQDLGLYLDYEIQASAVEACQTLAIKTETPLAPLAPPTGDTDSNDSDGNAYEFLQPGMVMNLRPGESIEGFNPSRPNSNAGNWIALMLRAFGAGMGTSYESVSKDFSNTSYSSSRTSKLENRPRYRRWQSYWKAHFCQPIWDEFCTAAAMAGRSEFPDMDELLTDRRSVAPVEFMPPVWEWVDVTAEQQASEAAINAHQTTYAEELGGRGRSWRRTFKQAAKEKALKQKLGLVSPEEAKAEQAIGAAKQGTAQAEQSLATAESMKAESASDPQEIEPQNDEPRRDKNGIRVLN
jgi:lambda family phage portal protein